MIIRIDNWGEEEIEDIMEGKQNNGVNRSS
jgi:hypothetical protein